MGVVPRRFRFLALLLILPSVLRLEIFCGNADLEALMKVKSALDPEGIYLSSWTAGEDPCSGAFAGVACNERGQVTNISLQGKGLSGSISAAMAELLSLTGLYLHYNALLGSIPKEISNLTLLSDLYLNVNNLSGNIPKEIGGMENLQVLQLGYNRLTGSIPTQLGHLKKLTVLSLKYNHLNGAIPANLGGLPKLNWVDLSFNQLFGSIPVKLSEASQLYALDLQNNSLSGSVPSELRRLNDGFKYDNNKDLCGVEFPSLRPCTEAEIPYHGRSQKPYLLPHSTGFTPQDIPLSANINSNCNKSIYSKPLKSSLTAVFIGVIIVLVAGTTLCLSLAFTWYLKQMKISNTGLLQRFDSKNIHCQQNELNRRRASPIASLEYSNGWDPLAEDRCNAGLLNEISQNFRLNLEEVECATQYFSEVNLVGKSSFSATYRGVLSDGTKVSVKCISKTSCKSEEAEFLKGLKIITKLQHENIVGLRGFSFSRERGECFLVYDFISHGKLSEYLVVKGQDNALFLDWPARVSLINGIAKGIAYLHCKTASKPIVLLLNISADKILLDSNFNPFLSCCGLHGLLADDVVFSSLKDSVAMGYLAPEYATTGRLTEKSDVYAFGKIVLQILLGKQRTSLLDFVDEYAAINDLIYENLKGNNFSRQEAAKLVDIALLCTCEVPSQRPTMETVLKECSFAMG